MRPNKTFLIDDHALVRTGMKQLLQDNKGIAVIGESSTGLDGIQHVKALMPDVVILDLKLPDLSGLEVTQKLLRINPDLKILIVSSITNDLFPFRLLEAGVQGYLSKDSSQEELILAIKTIFKGQRIISPKIAKRLALTPIDFKNDNIFADISPREREVMMMVIRGTPAKDIGLKLKISHKTVHSYRSRIFEKLNVKTDLALTLLAIHHGIIVMEEIS